MRAFIIIISVLADALDFTGIGHFAYPIDIAVIIFHLVYAGPKALIGILDMVPMVGLLPIYTVLAVTYDKK